MKVNYPKGEIFHVFNKSIANFRIFKDFENSQRFINTLDYYNNTQVFVSFSKFLKKNSNFFCDNLVYLKEQSYVKFLCHSIMPDHYHLLVKVLVNDYLYKFISDVENSFTRYFNIKFNRKGPLWQTSFKTVKIKTNEQLLHITRYIHLNSTSANLVDHPEDWKFSSYQKFIKDKKILKEVVTEISINNPNSYKKFIEDRQDYQRKLKLIKKLALE